MDSKLSEASGLAPIQLLALMIEPVEYPVYIDVPDGRPENLWMHHDSTDGTTAVLLKWTDDPSSVIEWVCGERARVKICQFWGVNCPRIHRSFFLDWEPSVDIVHVLSNPTRVVFAARPSAGDVVDLIDAENFSRAHAGN